MENEELNEKYVIYNNIYNNMKIEELNEKYFMRHEIEEIRKHLCSLRDKPENELEIKKDEEALHLLRNKYYDLKSYNVCDFCLKCSCYGDDCIRCENNYCDDCEDKWRETIYPEYMGGDYSDCIECALNVESKYTDWLNDMIIKKYLQKLTKDNYYYYKYIKNIDLTIEHETNPDVVNNIIYGEYSCKFCSDFKSDGKVNFHVLLLNKHISSEEHQKKISEHNDNIDREIEILKSPLIKFAGKLF